MMPVKTDEERIVRNRKIEEWKQANMRNVKLRLNLRTDADILARLDAVGNMQGYIKQLIREDIARNAD